MEGQTTLRLASIGFSVLFLLLLAASPASGRQLVQQPCELVPGAWKPALEQVRNSLEELSHTEQKRLCEQVINVFETGSIQGDYSAISIFHDGPHGIRQVTYGRAQTTEYGNLEELVQMYVEANGAFSNQLRPFVAKIGVTPLV